jgi:1,4-dihydroxy-2-naphthoate octaprenyltransferase
MVGSPCFLCVFLGLYFLLILLDYVFVMDFVYVHSSPWWYWCCLSAVVLSELIRNNRLIDTQQDADHKRNMTELFENKFADVII